MEGNLPDKRAFARWYIEKSLFLKDKDMIFLSVSHKELDKVKEIFADFKFENGKSFMESSSFFDTEKENILMKFSTDVSKEEYRVEVTTEYIDKRNVNEVEDIIEDIDSFNEIWLKECIRILDDNGTIWVSGTLHNHPSIGIVLKKLNLWIINDVIWFKKNAAPLLSKNRLAPSTELIWIASKTKKYYFDYDTAKMINGGKQMRNLWEINAQKHITSHPTEKPETLLKRIILLGSKKGDTILDPFMGSGTTGVIAKQLERNFIGFEINEEYFNIAKNRILRTNNISQIQI